MLNGYVHLIIRHDTTDLHAPPDTTTANLLDLQLYPSSCRNSRCFSQITVDFPYSTITANHVYYWWNMDMQDKYNSDENEFVSAVNFVDAPGLHPYRSPFQVFQAFRMIKDDGCWDPQVEKATQAPARLIYWFRSVVFKQKADEKEKQCSTRNCRNWFVTPLFRSMVDFREHIQEYFIDSTYKTNRVGAGLFGIIANVNGVGYPLGYMLYSKSVALSSEDEGTAKAITIREWFTKMKDLGFDPKFFFSDKDAATIQAIRTVFGEGRLRLCLWHLKRAVEKKLSSQKQQDPLTWPCVVIYTYVWCTIQKLSKDWSDIIGVLFPLWSRLKAGCKPRFFEFIKWKVPLSITHPLKQL